MIAMVSSNLADLMGATSPRTSQDAYETPQNNADSKSPESQLHPKSGLASTPDCSEQVPKPSVC
jgi:hypothetical protein